MDKKIYVMVSDTGTWLNKTIKTYTRAPYNHASLSLDEELLEMYSFGRLKASNPFGAGFIKEDVEKGTFRLFPNTKCAIYELNVTNRDVEKIRRIIRWFEQRGDKYRYNVVGLFGAAMQEHLDHSPAYFCSQFVADVLGRSGVVKFNKEPALITPEDLQSLPGSVLHYEGELYEYGPVKERAENW